METSDSQMSIINSQKDNKVYIKATPFLWGRIKKLQVIIREYQINGDEEEFNSILFALKEIEARYLGEFEKEDIHIARMYADSYVWIRL